MADQEELHKAYAYVVRERAGRTELLVFRHPDPEAGVQVPKGTIRPHEAPAEALLRELAEESGIELEQLGLVRMLRADRWRYMPEAGPPEWHIRYFFAVEIDDLRPRWQHVVTGEGLDQGMVFEFFWVPLPLKQELSFGMDAYVDRLVGR